MPSSQLIGAVDVETIELRIFNRDTPEATIEEFYRFGQILFTECLQRGSEVDRKLTSALGWSTASLAFLLLNRAKFGQFGAVGMIGLIVATISAIACVAISSVALKSRIWPAPSESDWFKEDLWQDSTKLKRFHVVSLLFSHQEHLKRIKGKADCLWWAELFLPVSALVVSAILLFS